MNKRSFFKSLALLAAGAAVAPGIFVPKFEPVRWKVTRPLPNPEWVKAEYEVYYIGQPGIFDPVIFKSSDFHGKWQFVEDDIGTEIKFIGVSPTI